MTSSWQAVDRFSRSLLVRGGALVVPGLAAILWPEATLPTAMMTAGALVILSGLYDVRVAAGARRAFRGWPLLAGHGAASVAFGLLTIGLARAPQHLAMTLVAAWMLAYGAMTGALALALWPMRRTRWTLLAATAIVIPAGLLATTLGDVPRFVPMYLGAFVAVFLGTLHLAGGLWLRRVAMPRLAPTLQSAWASPSSGTDEGRVGSS